MELSPDFWRGRRILLTGHTGFKGAWLALWLENLGAEVTGMALAPATSPNLFELLGAWPRLMATTGDLRDPAVSSRIMAETAPQVVFHLAAQALVRPSYRDPIGTVATNVLGTAHLLESIRRTPSVEAVIVVTSDKVYENDEAGRPFREGDCLGGRDPYSASKACQEIITSSYRHSFFYGDSVRIGSARAGNVIGGGDWAADRLVPDFVRAMQANQAVQIRNPGATRPWQHVLDPLAGYLLYAQRLCGGAEIPRALNFGPPAHDVRPVRWVVEKLTELWGEGPGWSADRAEHAPEARTLMLDASRATESLNWRPRLTLDAALEWTVRWYLTHRRGGNMRTYSLDQIERYQDLSP
jgi:CDP-glucose 4,6-dehydratase